MTSIDDTGLPPALSRALSAKGYSTLTDVQTAMLAPDIAGQDLLVSAQTGSGKTVAFGLAFGADLLEDGERLPKADAPLALVVAPTRELAMQVARELSWLYREAKVRVATCVGGMDVRTERQALARGAHIAVGTPGRLVDHITRGVLDLTALHTVVLDEADEMLNLGFREELEAILEACPQNRRTLMFSATVGGGISKLAARYQHNAMRISVAGAQRQHGDIAYHAMMTAQHDAERAIINVLRYHEAENAIVFCSTRAAVARLTSRLANRGLSVVSMSGELSQQERTNALQAMRDGRARVCVATDVAARGIDLPGLELVIHAELPKNREGLLHRSGRTGRAGRKGTSVLIVPPRARRRVERLLSDAKVEAEWKAPPNADEIHQKDNERLLSNPLLTEPTEPSELAKTIAETYSAEHLAAAIIRIHQVGRSAPEQLSEVDTRSEKPRERQPRHEITDSVWITLSTGRTNRAEARWILPMLCKVGRLKKPAIGAIRVRENETYVQLDAEGATEFLARIAKDNRLEDGIEARKADGPPGPEGRGEGRPERGEFQKRPAKPHPKTGTRDKAAPRARTGDDGPGAKFKRKPKTDYDPAAPTKPKPYGKDARKPFEASAAPHGEFAKDAERPKKPKKPKAKTPGKSKGKPKWAADGTAARKRPGTTKPSNRKSSPGA